MLVGHSMGGMAIMALAEQHPELFPDGRVAGVVLIATSAGELSGVTFGLPRCWSRFRKPLLPLISGAGWVTAGMLDRARRGLDRPGLAADPPVRLRLGEAEPGAGLLCGADELGDPHRVGGPLPAHALHATTGCWRWPRCADIPVLVICGDKDLLTPVTHSEEICRRCRTPSSSSSRTAGTWCCWSTARRSTRRWCRSSGGAASA